MKWTVNVMRFGAVACAIALAGAFALPGCVAEDEAIQGPASGLFGNGPDASSDNEEGTDNGTSDGSSAN